MNESYQFDLNESYVVDSMENQTESSQNVTETPEENVSLYYEKVEYEVNETVSFKIEGSTEKEYNLTITGPTIKVFTLNGSSNGTYLVETSFAVIGNYTVNLEDYDFNIKIRPKELEEDIKKYWQQVVSTNEFLSGLVSTGAWLTAIFVLVIMVVGVIKSRRK